MQTERLAYTIDEFCHGERISRGTFYNLEKSGKAPRTHNAGTKRLISVEARQEWLAEREAEASAKVPDSKVSQMRRKIGAVGNQRRIERVRPSGNR